ncbi:MAG: hypothetical protein IJE77_14010, partial [Thermoguttaceae bacterium]|nr:hypothetical protein [Thermoguttaceae bacterium]
QTQKAAQVKEAAQTEEAAQTGPASRRKIARSVASLVVAEADALGFDVEKLRTALKFWKEASSATAALSGVGRWVAAEAEAGCERLREAFVGNENDESETRREEREIRAKNEIKKKSERQDNGE